MLLPETRTMRRDFILLQIIAALLGMSCASRSTGSSPAAVQTLPSAHDDPVAGSQMGSQMTVGLRVALDRDSEEEDQVGIAAVVHDAEGHDTVTELGEFRGAVLERPPVGNELIHLTVGDDDLRLIYLPEGRLELRRMGNGRTPADSELIRWIEVPDHIDIRASDPPIELQP